MISSCKSTFDDLLQQLSWIAASACGLLADEYALMGNDMERNKPPTACDFAHGSSCKDTSQSSREYQVDGRRWCLSPKDQKLSSSLYTLVAKNSRSLAIRRIIRLVDRICWERTPAAIAASMLQSPAHYCATPACALILSPRRKLSQYCRFLSDKVSKTYTRAPAEVGAARRRALQRQAIA
jgi:hypothetical protein